MAAAWKEWASSPGQPAKILLDAGCGLERDFNDAMSGAAKLYEKLKQAQSVASATRRSDILDHAEVIGNVTAAMLDLDVTYDGNRATFTFLSTNDAMSYIQKARRIVEERLALIRRSDGGTK